VTVQVFAFKGTANFTPRVTVRLEQSDSRNGASLAAPSDLSAVIDKSVQSFTFANVCAKGLNTGNATVRANIVRVSSADFEIKEPDPPSDAEAKFAIVP
jgi:hypothetical protein